MALLALIGGAFALGVQQLAAWRYGPVGILGVLLFTLGLRTRHHSCTVAGAVLLALMVAQPAH
ncbi:MULTISPECIES: hypothetical protein [Streptomyces]|uniref:Uncharacterized protein n=1 Tax=Streptomyces albus (strain ATCC 21838 / DSM 41398 / FERM P-419 / JCM 4703 / NBRC 107858) TaxID=1081613 RepID=A0A0B5F2C1_STRA4|nr:hypothetical protein [Streptomyces sp. SCSIO ZS0520]AJE84462.1 hypothetical protein SLNWT_4086 [Streptomyces albus]AOU78773.1 hypothetical protein SLNHY_4082 [Streptomyces albus]AYN34507.1 hypothetical protein DUI70_4008 [Streptomyces albus]